MDAEIFADSIKYELLTKEVYEAILALDGHDTIDVQHNIDITGKSGVKHQVDVFWEFRVAGITHRVAVECKNYASNLTLEKTRNFFAVLHDIGNCSGVMVTKTGYQSGAAAFANFYGIQLKQLRKPTDEDWQGRISKVVATLRFRAPISNDEKPIECDFEVEPTSKDQFNRIQERQKLGLPIATGTVDSHFLDAQGNPITDEFRYWLPRQLIGNSNPDGGPYTTVIPLENHFFLAPITGDVEELVKIKSVTVTYYMETFDTREVEYDAKQAIEAILKDYESGKWEHIKSST